MCRICRMKMNKGETFRDLRGGIRGVEDDDQMALRAMIRWR
jgi:hypothetical protein